MAINYSVINGIKYLSGTTAQRPSGPVAGTTYFNTSVGALQIYQNGGWYALQNIVAPSAPTSVVATDTPSGRAYNNGAASVAFSPATETGGIPISFTVTSSPGSYTASGSSSPIVVTGLQSSTQYTYSVTATNSAGTSSSSSASSGVTATTAPQAPTIGTATAGNAQASVAFTAGSTGGSTITGYTVTSSPGNITATGSSSPITVTGLTNGTPYTFTVTATNANGTSAASSASSSVTPSTAYSYSGGSGWVNSSAGTFSNTTDTSLTRTGSRSWSCSDNTTYWGGSQTGSGQGFNQSAFSINNGSAIASGTYNFKATFTLTISPTPTSHDGVYLWLVTPSKKYYLGYVSLPGGSNNTTFTDWAVNGINYTTTEACSLEFACYDGSSFYAMGIQFSGFTLTKV